MTKRPKVIPPSRICPWGMAVGLSYYLKGKSAMNLSDAVKSIIKPHKDDKLTPLTTIWGEQLDPENLLPEYTRPQLNLRAGFHRGGR